MITRNETFDENNEISQEKKVIGLMNEQSRFNDHNYGRRKFKSHIPIKVVLLYEENLVSVHVSEPALV